MTAHAHTPAATPQSMVMQDTAALSIKSFNARQQDLCETNGHVKIF